MLKVVKLYQLTGRVKPAAMENEITKYLNQLHIKQTK